MKRHRAILLLITAVAAVIGLMVPAPAMAAVHCDGSGCNGKKITDTDCMAQAYAIGGLAIVFSGKTVARGDLWYSPSCHAMWGDYNATEIDVFADVELQTQPEYGGVNAEPFSQFLRGPGNVTTTMIDWQQSVRLCANGGTLTCTPWR